MLNALTKGKKFLTDLFESSTLAYDQRDEWCTKLKSVQEKGRMDQLLQVQEMRDLQKSFDHEMKLYNFLSKKGVIRINEKEEKRVEEQKIAREKQLKEKYSEHVKIINDINAYTQKLDINKIIEEFQHTEQKNFSVYKMLTEYCAENEVLGRDLQRIRQNLEDRKDWIEMTEEKQNNKLKMLRQQLEQKSKITQNLRQQLEIRTQQLNDSMEKVYEIFKMLDCSLEPFHNLLGDKRPSFHCLNLTFCLITEKINELIHTAFYYVSISTISII
ncbi:PREDICTED: coiled-coil domain-containing protein 63-like [Papilio polytes]|uniref:coiled-coil domain-containing protein 63-like n=1 Tax=Papilio polytes TaxID=76194 RepID=UPI0006760A03|nr:PREDICTED: coiled-coil domain-containing protein 63-like [Papilio polytes]